MKENEIYEARLKILKALESGRYKQTTGKYVGKREGKLCYCAIGVAARVTGLGKLKNINWDYGGSYGFISGEDHTKLTKILGYDTECAIISRNDYLNHKFKDIAEYLRSVWNIPKEQEPGG